MAEEAIATAKEYLARYDADNAALVSLDPRNGKSCMVGSADYFDTEHAGNFNIDWPAPRVQRLSRLSTPVLKKGTWSPARPSGMLEPTARYRPQNFDGSERDQLPFAPRS